MVNFILVVKVYPDTNMGGKMKKNKIEYDIDTLCFALVIATYRSLLSSASSVDIPIPGMASISPLREESSNLLEVTSRINTSSNSSPLDL